MSNEIKQTTRSVAEIDNMATVNELSLSMDGDSICALSSSENNIRYAKGSFIWGNTLLGSPFEYVDNFGVGGERTDEVLNRIDTTLLTSAKYIHFIMGKNDVGQYRPYDDIIANMTSIFNATQKAGKIVVMSTIIPIEISDPNGTNRNMSTDSLTSEQKTSRINLISEINLWIKEQAKHRKNYIVVDYYNGMVNPETGYAKYFYTLDGIHPNSTGAHFMGLEFKKALENIVPTTNLFTNNNMVDTTQLLANSLFKGGTDVAPSWIKSTNGIATKDSNDYQVIKNNDVTQNIAYSQTILENFVVGDTVSVLADIETTDITEIGHLRLELIFRDVNRTIITDNRTLTLDGTDSDFFPNENFNGVLIVENLVVPDTTTSILVQIHFAINGAMKIKKCQLFNLG